MTAVTFVHDYFQLQLGDATLNIYWPSQLVSGDSTHGFGDSGFTIAARGLLSLSVSECRSSDEEFSIVFSDGSRLLVSYHQEEAEGPEALSIQTQAGLWVGP